MRATSFPTSLLVLWLAVWPRLSRAIELTPPEAAFLHAHPVWKMAGASAPPFQFRDDKGQFQGMAQDYRVIIERELGVKLEPVPAATWDASLEQLRLRECDVSLLTAETPARSEFLIFTEPLLTLPLAIITRRDAADIKDFEGLTGKRVAVGRQWPIHERLLQIHRGLTLLPRDDVGSALSAVALGDADVYVGDLPQPRRPSSASACVT